MQQAGHVAEVADRTQTLQHLRQIALFPAAITSTHLQKEAAKGRKMTADHFNCPVCVWGVHPLTP